MSKNEREGRKICQSVKLELAMKDERKEDCDC